MRNMQWHGLVEQEPHATSHIFHVNTENKLNTDSRTPFMCLHCFAGNVHAAQLFMLMGAASYSDLFLFPLLNMFDAYPVAPGEEPLHTSASDVWHQIPHMASYPSYGIISLCRQGLSCSREKTARQGSPGSCAPCRGAAPLMGIKTVVLK